MENGSPKISFLQPEGSLKSYIIGFILSIALTLAAYYLVVDHILTSWPLIIAVSGLAVAQVLVQLFFFLHLGKEPSPYWNIAAMASMLFVLAILVIGTLWIMYNLDYNMMSNMTDIPSTPGI